MFGAFPKRWQSGIGLALLLSAGLFLAGWVRSISMPDVITLHWNQSILSIRSYEGLFDLRLTGPFKKADAVKSKSSPTHKSATPLFSWRGMELSEYYEAIGTQHFQPRVLNTGNQWEWAGAVFAFEQTSAELLVKPKLPYLLITLLLTLLSS